MSSRPTEPLRVTIIGGYLGAGKTTLLNRVLANAHGLRAAVVVNDFGSVNIDARLVVAHDGETVQLANGCLCCSLSDGFTETLLRLQERAQSLDWVFVEASGVADPQRIGYAAQSVGLDVDATLVLADADAVRSLADDRYVGDTVRRQIANADVLVVNKVDLADDAALVALRQWFDGLAPSTPRLETRLAEVPLALLVGPDRIRRDGTQPATPEAPPHVEFETRTFTAAAPVAKTTFETLRAELTAKAYRAKGFVRLANAPGDALLFQLVGARSSLTPSTATNPSEPALTIVAIGRPGSLATIPFLGD